MPNDDATRIKASEIDCFLESGVLPTAIEEGLERIMKIFREEGNSNFILGKVIIENDLDEPEDE